MKTRTTLLLLAAALLYGTTSAQAQQRIYKWTNEDGQPQYSDRPPPPGVHVEEQRVFSGRADTVPAFSMRVVAANFPVVLYTSADCGEHCNTARQLLQNRGIPFREVVVEGTEESLAAYRQVFGVPETVPSVLIGREQIKGYAASIWHEKLDEVGYPSIAPPEL